MLRVVPFIGPSRSPPTLTLHSSMSIVVKQRNAQTSIWGDSRNRTRSSYFWLSLWYHSARIASRLNLGQTKTKASTPEFPKKIVILDQTSFIRCLSGVLDGCGSGCARGLDCSPPDHDVFCFSRRRHSYASIPFQRLSIRYTVFQRMGLQLMFTF